MEKPAHHPDLRAFIASVTALEDILRRHEGGFWTAKVTRVRQLAEASDGHCIELLLRMNGGMGSFNDLVLNAPAQAIDALNDERQRAYLLAQSLK